MLRVGLTGGIGAGKSSVADRLTVLGAAVVDADRIAREVVAPGTEGLAAIREAFGDSVIGADGALDRPTLAAIVFAGIQARQRLEAITHPRIAALTEELIRQAERDLGPAGIAVHDVPLLVEKRMGAAYHLVVVVDAPAEIRVQRLITRGLSETDARSRMSAQADHDERHRAADAWLDNDGSLDALNDQVDRLWTERLVPFARNLIEARPPDPAPQALPAGPRRREAAARVVARLQRHLADRAAHIRTVRSQGTDGDGLPEPMGPIRLEVELAAGAAPGGPGAALLDLTPAGFVPAPTSLDPWAPDHVSADPGLAAEVRLRGPHERPGG